MKSKPFKTRYTIIEPGRLRADDLFKMTWVDVELSHMSSRGIQDPRFRDQPMLDLAPVLNPIFPEGWEHMKVNSFKGGADMFVGERSAMGPKIVKNDGATLIYWTATALKWIARNIGEPPTYAEMHRTALNYAAEAMDGFGPLVTELRESTPRVYGKAVLFEDEVWT
jgi:hypothetical protein